MYVSEQEGDLGQYLLQTGLHNSNTALVKYLFGADPSEVRRDVENGVIAVVRETKDRIKNNKKPLSQDDAITVAFAGIQAQQSKYTVFGSEIHKACENFWKGRLVTLPTPRHQAYFRGFLYYKNQHVMRPLLVEELLVCPHCGLATQVDWYGEIDGKFTNLDNKTGFTVGKKTALQLTAQRHVLEHNGYQVDQSQALHISADFAYPITFDTPWEEYETLMKAFEIKQKYMQPKIYVREFADKKEASSETLKTSIEQESAQTQVFLGHKYQQGVPAILPKVGETEDELQNRLVDTYLGPADTRPLETVAPILHIVPQTHKRRRGRPHKNPSANTSSRKAVTRPRSPRAEEELNPSLVRQLSNAKRQKLQAA